MAKVYWNKLKANQGLPIIKTQPLKHVDIALYASGTGNFHPAYFDSEFALANGFGGQCAHSDIAFHLCEEALIHFGENLKIAQLCGTYFKLIHPGDTLETKCIIKKHYHKDKKALIDIECHVLNQRQEKIMQGHATCAVWENEKTEKNSPTKFPPH